MLQCALGLATSCGYPPNYFNNMAASSDEDLEIERNDVRDILRTVTGSGEGGSTADAAVAHHGPLSVSIRILSQVLHSCHKAVVNGSNNNNNTRGGDAGAVLFPEAAAHAFSSLAKPLNALAKYAATQASGSSARERLDNILDLAMNLLCRLCQATIQLYGCSDITPQQVLPRSRIVDIAICSMSPMLSARYQSDENIARGIRETTLPLVLEAATLSLERLPELAAESTLGRTPYDVRGTMRGPGGEDHVGCLAMMRLSNESPALTLAVVAVAAPFIARLCHIHHHLKLVELERGMGVHHGKGMTATSRRILLNALSHLELSSNGQAGASSALEGLFHDAIATLASFHGHAAFNEQSLYTMCEATFDLAAFSPAIVASLFAGDHDPTGQKTACMESLTSACIRGYQSVSTSESHSEATIQVR